MVLPHYVRSTEINVPNNEEKQRGNVKNGDLYTPESPELDVPLLLPQDSEALDTSKCNDTLQSNRSSLDRTSRDYESSSNFQNVKAESLAQHTQIHEIVDQVQYDNIFDHIFPSSNQNSVDWWEAQEQDEVKYTSEPLQIGPRTFCHCQVSSDCSMLTLSSIEKCMMLLGVFFFVMPI